VKPSECYRCGGKISDLILENFPKAIVCGTCAKKRIDEFLDYDYEQSTILDTKEGL